VRDARHKGTLCKGFVKRENFQPSISDSLDCETRKSSTTPGPGSYNTLLLSPSPSVSKKGMGNGFVSESHRFPRAPPIVFQQPGPGQYFNALHSTAQSSSVAPRKIIAPKAKQSVQVYPGPGDYNTCTNNVSKTNGTSSFVSTTKRTEIQQPKTQTPGPGRYNAKISDSSSVHTITSSFLSSTKRSDNWPKHVSPGPSDYNTSPQNANNAKVIKPKYKTSPSTKIQRQATSSTPGPGTYLNIVKSIPSHYPSPISPPYLLYKTQKTKKSALHHKEISATVGPGSYHKENTLVKQSFHCGRSDVWSV